MNDGLAKLSAMPALVCVSAPPSNLLGSNCLACFSSAACFSRAAFCSAAILACASALCFAANALPSSLIPNEPALSLSPDGMPVKAVACLPSAAFCTCCL